MAQCFNCQEDGHISANCPKAWKHFRCLNCDKAWEHAASCTSKWFNLRATFTHCENAADSKVFNRMEYQRQQLEQSIKQMREKRTNELPPVNVDGRRGTPRANVPSMVTIDQGAKRTPAIEPNNEND